MIRTVIPPIVDHNNMTGALGFILLLSTSKSMMNIDIVVTKIMILVYTSAFVKNSKKECNVLSSFSFNQPVIDHWNRMDYYSKQSFSLTFQSNQILEE